MLKISYAASPCLSQLASAQFAVEICFAAQIKLPKIHNCQNPILAFKVIEFDGNREPVYDFLLVPRPYLAPLLTLAKNRKFFLPHLAPLFGVTPFEFMEKFYGS